MFGLYGKLSFYPLRWSDAFFTSHRFAANLALNPVLFLADTIGAAEGEEFDPEKAREHYDRMAHYLGVEKPDKEALDFRRTVKPTPLLAKDRPNIVVISLESLANHLTGFFGNELDPVARTSTRWLRNRSSTTSSSRRAPAPRAASSPRSRARPTPRRTSPPRATRRLVDQYVMLDKFPGYETFYFIGGSANWANVRGLLKGNIAGLQIYEGGDVRGAAHRCLGHLRPRPAHRGARGAGEDEAAVLRMLICSGNHKPYSIPDDRANSSSRTRTRRRSRATASSRSGSTTRSASWTTRSAST